VAGKRWATQNETRFARAFLQKLGVRHRKNDFLVTAVVAWMRLNTHGIGKGNNLLGIRRGGKLVHYASLEAGAAGAARRVLKDKYHGYRAIVQAVRKNNGTSRKGYYTSAASFIKAVVLSDWDANHYGGAYTQNGPYGSHWLEYNQQTDRLYQKYAWMKGITNVVVTWTVPDQPKPKKQKPPPKPQAFHIAQLYAPEYLVGAETKAFYDARHPYGLNVLPPGLDGTLDLP